MNGTVCIFLCEPFRMTAAEGEVHRLRTRRTESLLSFLALQRGRWIHRDELISELWPDEDATNARGKLRLALHSIRRVVGDGLESKGDQVRLNEVWVDALDAGPHQLSEYQILPGRVEPWVMPFQLDLEQRIESDLLAELRGQPEPTQRIETLSKLVRLNPTRPGYYQELYAALTASASHAAALATARQAVANLGEACPADLFEAAEASRHLGALGKRVSPVLQQLAHRLLSDAEPAVVTLVGPAGVGKTHLAQQLRRLAPREDIASVWVSLEGISNREHLKAVIDEALADAHGVIGTIEDLPSTLLVLDNAEDLDESAADSLGDWLVPGTGLRILVTTQVAFGERLNPLRMPTQSLPYAAEVDAIIASETGRMLLDLADVQLDDANVARVHELCLSTGGIPLAIKFAAKELQLGLPSESASPAGRSALFQRLELGYARLTEESRMALATLLHLRPAFHREAAADAGVDRDTLEQLVDASWIEPTATPGVFEVLPPFRRFVEQHSPASALPTDFAKRLAARTLEAVQSNYLRVYDEIGPSASTLEGLIELAIENENLPLACQLFSAHYFCHQRGASVQRTIHIGRRLFGDTPNPRWDVDSRALNFFASAAYFGKQLDLAEALFAAVAASEDPQTSLLGTCNLGLIALTRGEARQAVDLLRLSLTDPSLTVRQRASRQNNFAKALALAGDLQQAHDVAREALESCDERDDLTAMRSVLQFSLAEIELLRGALESALMWGERAQRYFQTTGERIRATDASLLLGYLSARLGGPVHNHLSVLLSLRRPDLPAEHWAPAAAAVLLAKGEVSRARELVAGLTLDNQSNWVQVALEPLLEAGQTTAPPMSNLERLHLFQQLMKRM